MTKSRFPLLLAILACLVAALPATAQTQFGTRLRAFDEVPALSTPGAGRFTATFDEDSRELTYELEYRNLEGTVTQAHIHFGAPWTAGGIVLFLCSNLGNGPAGTPACPSDPATVTGTVGPADVTGGALNQGIAPGEMFSVLRALRAGLGYVNVHSTTWPGGEIRGQLRILGTSGILE